MRDCDSCLPPSIGLAHSAIRGNRTCRIHDYDFLGVFLGV